MLQFEVVFVHRDVLGCVGEKSRLVVGNLERKVVNLCMVKHGSPFSTVSFSTS